MTTTSLWPPYIKQTVQEYKMRNSVVDNFVPRVGNDQEKDKEGVLVAKKGSWFAYNDILDEFYGPFDTKGEALEGARVEFEGCSDSDREVWLCQAVQKVIFTRKVHVVEFDE